MFQAKMNILTEQNNERVLQIRYNPTSINLEDREAEAFVDSALSVGKKVVVERSQGQCNENIVIFKVVDE